MKLWLAKTTHKVKDHLTFAQTYCAIQIKLQLQESDDALLRALAPKEPEDIRAQLECRAVQLRITHNQPLPNDILPWIRAKIDIPSWMWTGALQWAPETVDNCVTNLGWTRVSGNCLTLPNAKKSTLQRVARRLEAALGDLTRESFDVEVLGQKFVPCVPYMAIAAGKLRE